MQQRMQEQTRGMFSSFPFPPFDASPPSDGDEDKNR
jgi:hypothetical protein